MTAPEKLRKNVVSILEDFGRGEGMRTLEAFECFLEAGYRALRGKTLVHGGTTWRENEAMYERAFERLQKPEIAKDRIAEVLAFVTIAIDQKCADFLGPLWMEIGSSSALGQFFTPHELSRLTAEITIGDMKKLIADTGRPYFTAHEPAAGMGGMVLAVAEMMREEDLDPSINCFWQMVELDHSVFRGCYIQTSLAGIAGAVIHGNTLSLEVRSGSAYTPAALTFMAYNGVPDFGPPCEGYDRSTSQRRAIEAEIALDL